MRFAFLAMEAEYHIRELFILEVPAASLAEVSARGHLTSLLGRVDRERTSRHCDVVSTVRI